MEHQFKIDQHSLRLVSKFALVTLIVLVGGQALDRYLRHPAGANNYSAIVAVGVLLLLLAALLLVMVRA
jgi:hypothetical protein